MGMGKGMVNPMGAHPTSLLFWRDFKGLLQHFRGARDFIDFTAEIAENAERERKKHFLLFFSSSSAISAVIFYLIL
jgi:hypothetical protein